MNGRNAEICERNYRKGSTRDLERDMVQYRAAAEQFVDDTAEILTRLADIAEDELLKRQTA